jgi:hypothetical protein
MKKIVPLRTSERQTIYVEMEELDFLSMKASGLRLRFTLDLMGECYLPFSNNCRASSSADPHLNRALQLSQRTRRGNPRARLYSRATRSKSGSCS